MFEGLREDLVGICARMSDYEERVIQHVPCEARPEVQAKVDAVRDRCNYLLRYISTLKFDDLAAKENIVIEVREIRKKALRIFWPENRSGDLPASL